MYKSHRKSNRRKGFTLIEIMLVVGIIAMLAAFVVPQFMGREEDAKKMLTQRLVGPRGELSIQIDLFYQDFKRYPETLDELTQKPDDEEEAEKWKGYIKSADGLDDPWGNRVVYTTGDDAVNEGSFDLCSNGPDGEAESDDDICNYKQED